MAKKCDLGCVNSPLQSEAESRNLGQTFLANSVHGKGKYFEIGGCDNKGWGVEEERWILSPLETYPLCTQVVKKREGPFCGLRNGNGLARRSHAKWTHLPGGTALRFSTFPLVRICDRKLRLGFNSKLKPELTNESAR